MPDTRKRHFYPGGIPGFKMGQGRFNETGVEGKLTIDGTTYYVHVTVERTSQTPVKYIKAPGQKKGRGKPEQFQMIDEFHVSLYREDRLRATGYYWRYSTVDDRYVALGWQEAPARLPWTTAEGARAATVGVTNRAERRIRTTFGSTLQAAGETMRRA